ncbi:MAG: response regulator [Myxococcales bacterium]|nr:response regulator [Myxococcales bacterium]
MKILVVDDEKQVRTVVIRLLEFLGHEVVEADSGEVALVFLKERSEIELVLLDEQMPGLLGSEVLVQLRTFRPKLPVLLSSGAAGVDNNDPYAHILNKPYRLDTLESALAKVVELP